MDRAQTTGLGISAAGHLAMLAALSLGLAATRLPPPTTQPIEVSFVKDIGPTNAAPQISTAPPAQSAAPEAGPPDEAAPAPAPIAPPKPPPPVPAPPPPAPAARPAPKPAEAPAATRPAPPKPAPARAKPAKPVAHPAPAAPAAAAPAMAAPTHSAPARPGAGTATAARGARLSLDFLKGVSDPSPSRAQQPPAAVMSAEALASIKSAIQRQVQPCADRQVNPGPGASQIQVTLNLRLNRDGSLARTPTVVRTSGVTAENGRYEDRVKDLAVATYTGCSPLHGLPDELYQTPKGGWANVNLSYHLP